MACVTAHSRRPRNAGVVLLASVAGFGAATVVFGLSRSLWLSFAMLVLTGAFDNVSVVLRHSLVQTHTPDHLRGRVLAINSIFISCSNQLGAVESGWTAAWFGAVPSVVGGGAATLAIVAGFAARAPARCGAGGSSIRSRKHHACVSLLFGAAAALAAPCTEAGSGCMERVTVEGQRFLMVYRSHPLTAASAVDRARLRTRARHGARRGQVLRNRHESRAGCRSAGSTLVIAPEFHARDGRCADEVEPGELRFTCNGWKEGAKSVDAPADAFDAMDRILTLLGEPLELSAPEGNRCGGHSAGGQYVQRYAATNLVEPHCPCRCVIWSLTRRHTLISGFVAAGADRKVRRL